MKVNAAWHKKNPMPNNPSLEQRLRWHVRHTKACACRELTPKLKAEMKARGIPVPKYQG